MIRERPHPILRNYEETASGNLTAIGKHKVHSISESPAAQINHIWSRIMELDPLIIAIFGGRVKHNFINDHRRSGLSAQRGVASQADKRNPGR